MKLMRARGITWVMGTLAVAMIPQLISMPAHLVPLTLTPLLWRLMAEIRGWKPMPALLRLAVTVLMVISLVVTYGGLVGRRAAVSLLTLMLSLKLIETFKVRDARVVASLSLFLCVTQFLFQQGITMFFYGAACLVSALVSLVYLHREEAFKPVGKDPGTGMSIFSELGFSARMLAISVPAAMMVFLLFPRWGSPLWGIPEAALDARSGLSNSMEPGSIQGLFMDDTPAFRAEFNGDTPPHTELYWRGPVFWRFDGRRWDSGYFARNNPASSKPRATSAPWKYEIQQEPTEQHWLFALDYPALVPRGARLTLDYQLYSRRPITQLRTYTMASDPQFTDSPELMNTLRRSALDVPEGYNPQTRELMSRWREEFPDDRRLIQNVLSHFRREGFRYTLNPPLLSRHTVDEFLFETRSGFCEHYASAFTQMMRMAGIPARVVTGYQGGWYNDVGNYLLVRQSDAHAWSEVWIEGVGWARVDPTAAVSPDRVENGALNALGGRRTWYDYQWLRSIRNGFDLVQRGWNNWVVMFDSARQSRMFRMFGLENADARMLVAIMLAGLLLVAILLMPFILRMRASRRPDPAVIIWSRFLKKLGKTGLKVSTSTGALELASHPEAQKLQNHEAVRKIADLYTRYRYSQTPPALDQLKRAVQAFKVKAETAPA